MKEIDKLDLTIYLSISLIILFTTLTSMLIFSLITIIILFIIIRRVEINEKRENQ